jgi:hypothetical protein
VTDWSSPAGIDSFAWVGRHEDFHLSSYQSIWGGGGWVSADDPDADFGSTAWEDATAISWQANLTIGGVSVNHYDPALRATSGLVDLYGYGAGFDDPEDWCMHGQPRWNNGDANHLDWGSPGMQHATSAWDD